LRFLFDNRGVVHHKYAPEGQTVNSIIKRFSVVFMMQFGTRDRTCGSHTTGSCIMTTSLPILRVWSKNSWPSTKFPRFTTLLTLQTWLLVISGCSPSWRCRWNGPDLRAERT
jgi:hypothetical protein